CSKDSEEAPDITPPSVDFSIKGVTQSNTGAPPIIGNTVEIEISAQDAKGISKVEAFIDDAKVGEDKEAPFKITIDLYQYAKKLSGKGTAINKTQTLYTLKVSATDLSGNVSSVEQDIIVDNEMPTITEVTLENNAVITGAENEVTFKASDNEGITSLEVKINDVVVESTLDSLYRINIDTSVLEDGPNNLNITAIDEAGNTATYEAPFLADNTGPEITLEGLLQDSVIDESAVFSILAEDLYSDIDSLKVFVNDSVIVSSDAPDVNLDFNPDDYATGDTTLKITAVDILGNTSTQEVGFQIKRLLVKINVPEDFLDPSISKFYVFASDSTGAVLDIKPLEFNTSFLKLNTLADISADTEYMLSFAYLYSGVGETSIIKTIQNVKRSTLDIIDLKNPERKSISAQNTYQASAIPTGISVVGEGSDYNSTWDTENPGNGYYLEDYDVTGAESKSNQYYIYYHNTTNNNYGYQFADKPLASDFVLDYNNFVTDGVETRYINASSIQDPNKNSSLWLYGYVNATDFENGINHRIWAYGSRNDAIIDNTGLRYAFNSNFYNYSYKATLENYHIEAIGEPLDYYTAPDWTVDYTYSS